MKLKLGVSLSALALSQSAICADSTKLQDVQVVTSAAGFEQNIADAPASISVITGEELQKKAYTDVLDAIKNMPGIYASGGGNHQDITIRGMGAAYTKYLVNGRDISAGRSVNTNGTDGGKVGAYLPPIDMIERIEVIRGPMSSLYGSDAMGGIINIITKKAASDRWRGSITPQYTKADKANDVSNDGYSLSTYLSGPLIKDVLALSIDGALQGDDESDFQGGNANKSNGSRTEKKVRKVGSELTYSLNEQNDVSARYDYTKQEYTANPGKTLAIGADPSYTNLQKQIYTLTHKGRFENFTTDTYYQNEKTKKLQTKLLEEKLDLFKTMSSYVIGDHIITFGGQYKKEMQTNEANGLIGATPIAVDRVDRWEWALFLEDEYSISDDFALTAGIRYNYDELFGGYMTPRLYVVYHLNENLTLKGGVSTGYKQPTLAEATEGFGQTTGGGDWQSKGLPHARGIIMGNPNLRPEKSISYEAGFNFADEQIGLNSSIMAFHTEFKDKIQEIRPCQGATADKDNYANWNCTVGSEKYWFISSKDNIDKAQMQGIEATLDYALLENLKFGSSYTYTKSKQKTGDFQGQPLNKMPKHMFNANLSYDATSLWNFWTQYNYRGKTSDYLSRTAMADGTPAYATLDLGLVFKVTKDVTFTAGVYNLANKEITNDEYDVVIDGRRYTVGLNYRF